MNPATHTSGRIIQLWMEITRLLRRRMSGVRMPQIHGMLVIAEHSGITMKEWADHLHVTSPSATSFADRLVKQGWIARSADSENRKLVRLTLLPAGKTALDRAIAEHSAVMHDLFSLLSGDDQAQFARILTNLKEALARDVPSV